MKKGKILLVSSLLFFGTLIGTTLTSCGPSETEKEEDKFIVKLSFDNAKGSVTASTTSGKVGEKVTLTITPKTGYEVGTIKINGSSVEAITREFTPVKGENTVAVTFNEIVDPVDTAEVTLVQAEHGTISASKTSGNVGDEITITVTPDSGYELDWLKHNETDITATKKFTLVKGENKVTVAFKSAAPVVETAEVTLVQSENGTITASKTSGNVGDEVTITVTPDSGYELDWLKHNNTDITTTKKFNLVKGENKVTVAFKAVAPVVETASVTVEETTNGTISVSKTSGEVGEEIIVTVTPAEGYELDWLKHNETDITEAKKFTLVSGENKVTASFKKSLVPVQLKTFYFKDVDELNEFGTTAYVYAYNSADPTIKNAEWPGEEITYVSYDLAHDGANIYTFDLDVANYNTMVLSTKYEDQTEVIGQTVDISLKDLDETSDFFVLSGTKDADGKYEGSFTNYANYLNSIKATMTLEFDDTKGSVTLDKETYNEGDDVTLIITPKEGYLVDTVVANNEQVTLVEEKYVFKAIKGENIINVTFKEDSPEVETATVIIEETTNGTISVNKTSGNVGDEIIVTVTPAEGYELEWLKHNDTDITETKKFALVSGENKLTASFKKSLVLEELKTFYFKDVDALNEYGTVAYVYAYNSKDDSIRNADWPGEEITYLSNNIANDGANIYTFDLDVANYDTMVLSTKYPDQENPIGQTINIDLNTIGDENNFIVLSEENKDENGKYIPTYSNYETYIDSIKSIVNVTYDESLGEVTYEGEEFYAGKQLVLNATPIDGYEIKSVTLNGEEVTFDGEEITITLVAGNNDVVVTFAEKEEIDVPVEETKTIYFKDVSWWNADAASTRIFLYDANRTLITTAEDTTSYLGESMNYLNNPGYYENSNYWSYEIDTSKVFYVQFIRTSDKGTDDWGARTDLLEVTAENNFVTLGDTAKWYGDGNYAEATWSYKELSEFTREECEVNFVYDDTKGNVTLNGLAFADSTVGFSVTPNEGFIVDTIKINGEEVDPLTRSFETVKGETYTIEVNFKEGVAETYTLYFKTISELEEWGPKAFAYMFNSATNENNGAWPGVEMTSVSFDEETNTHLWKIEGVDPTKFDTIIFSVGWTDNIVGQTADIPFSDFISKEVNFYTLIEKGQDGKYIGEWSVYEA